MRVGKGTGRKSGRFLLRSGVSAMQDHSALPPFNAKYGWRRRSDSRSSSRYTFSNIPRRKSVLPAAGRECLPDKLVLPLPSAGQPKASGTTKFHSTSGLLAGHSSGSHSAVPAGTEKYQERTPPSFECKSYKLTTAIPLGTCKRCMGNHSHPITKFR